MDCDQSASRYVWCVVVVALMSGVKVLDVGQRISAPYCAKTLANMGAEVIKVEPLEGDEARRMGPFPSGEQHPEKSGIFLALNANKFGVTLDLTSNVGKNAFRKLAQEADVIVENLPLCYMANLGLGFADIKVINPGIIFTSITPFGHRSAKKAWKATDLTLFHMSGNAHELLGPVADPDTEPPIRAGGHQAEFVAGLAAVTATLTALFQRRMTGNGTHVDLSSYEALVTQGIAALASETYGLPRQARDLSKSTEASVTAVGGILPCNDGYVAISPREDGQWERWLEVIGRPDWSTDERFATRSSRQSNISDLWNLLGKWSRQHSKHDIARWGQRKRIPCFAVNTISDLLQNEHLASREFFVEIDHPIAGNLRYPGVPYKFSNASLPLSRLPAPMLGEHNAPILGERQ